MTEDRKPDYGEGCLNVVFGGMVVFIGLAILLGFAGFDQHQIFKAWVALSAVWAPALFYYASRQSK